MGSWFPLIVFVALFVGLVEPHGMILRPLARHAHYRDPSYPQNVPMYWDGQGVWCDNIQQDEQYSQCGRCGDGRGKTSFNLGGEYGSSYVGLNWTAGSIVDVVSDLQAAHEGSIQIELCPSAQETDNCFQVLNMVGGSGTIRNGNRMCVPGGGQLTSRVQLPAGIRCERCTVRWTYRTSYMGTPGYEPCYTPTPTQTFRNCANVRIN